jgi:hypothetical protein
MTGIQAIIFGFACAFTWVEVLHLGSRKPFNCVKCLSGWFTLIIAGVWHVEYWPFYLPVGVAVGAIYSALKMRYL